MDISEKYIEMCRQAIEIQNLWKRDDGDFAYTDGDLDSYSKGTRIIWHYKMAHGGYHNWDYNWYMPEGCIWLPRQDQLQDMVMPEFEVYGCDAIEHFMDVFHGFQEENNPLFDSMEELTLAFVMHQNYQKKWNGIKWVVRVNES
jgi:hypothetical protein